MHIAGISMYNTNFKYGILGPAYLDQQYLKIKETLHQGNLKQKCKYYEMKEDGIIMYIGKVYVSNSNEMKNIVLMREMHNVPYVGNPGYHKTIAVVRIQYF
jgi:hypothetical protein